MAKSKLFTSARKLNSLPVGAEIRFGEAPYGRIWRKEEGGWREVGSSFSLAWPAETVVHFNNGRPFNIEEV